jgi:hypothetical protein
MSDDQIFRFIEAIKSKLFEPEERRLKTAIDRLVERNDSDAEHNYQGFMFSGEVYRHSRANVLYKSYPMLAWSLNEEMETWLKDQKAVNLDRDQIGQMLFKLQSRVIQGGENTMQEMRDALPECLVPLVPRLQNLPRRFNTLFFLQGERDLKQYNKLLPKIEMYAMSRLIY